MAIRSRENLIDKVSADYIWRIKEISEYKAFVTSSLTPEHKQRILCRAGVALLYAHWEGFVKKSSSYFLEFVSMQRLTISEINSNFVTLMLKNKIDSLSETKKYSAFDDIATLLLHAPTSQAKIPFKNVVDTKSNLSSVILKEIMWCLGLDYHPFASKEKLLDQRLLSRRNHIAHGEIMPIEKSDFLDLADEVLGLMLLFRNLVENSAVQEAYKK